MSVNNQSRGLSENDNEMAGRLLLMGALAVAAVVFLALCPILIAGFLIALTWYGAYMEDGEPNGERLAMPVLITVALFFYLLGIPPAGDFFSGMLLGDLRPWTMSHVVRAIQAFNQMLPRKMEIAQVKDVQLRFYGWAIMPAAMVFFGFLHFKGAGRGLFLYQGMRVLFTPFRMMAALTMYSMIGIGALVLLAFVLGAPAFISQGLIGIAALVLVYRYLFMKEESIGSESAQGSNALLANSESVAKSFGPILVGHEKGKPNKRALVSEEQLNHHVHIVGASGFGKSVLLSHIIENRIASGSGLLFVDLKADYETIRQVVSNAKAAGRMNDLYIFSCGNPEISSGYNVLANGTANQLKDRIMGALDWSEEFYENEASSFLLKLLMGFVVLRDKKGKPFHLGFVLDCLKDTQSIESIIDALPMDDVKLIEQLEGLVMYLKKPENFRALQGLRSQLESLLLSDFGHLLITSGDGIDLFKAIRDQKIVYVLLDSRTYGESAKSLGKLILQDLKAASARVDNELSRDKRAPFTVVVDEFADLATEDFISFLDRARSSKIGVVVAHQEIADLSRVSPEFTRRLMNSTSSLFAFLQKLPDSAELISGIAGTKKTKEVTEQAKSNWLFGDEKTGMKSVKEVDEFLIHPNTIKSLQVGECVLVQKYPKSLSQVLKIRPQSQRYLPDQLVKEELDHMANRFKATPEPLQINKAVFQRPRALSDADKF